MKQRYRDIIVDNIKYSWSYLPNTDPYEDGGDVKIWKDKKVIFLIVC